MDDTPPEPPPPDAAPPPHSADSVVEAPPAPLPVRWTHSRRWPLVVGTAAAVGYGIIAWVALQHFKALPSFTFLFLVPVAMGALPSVFTDDDQVDLYTRWLFVPWLTVFTYFAALVLAFKEAAICLVVLTAPLTGGVMVGTGIAWLVKAIKMSEAKRKKALAATALLPLVFVGLERAYLMPAETDGVESAVVIASPAGAIFAQLAEVETLRDDEYTPGLFNRLGVPRPIRATCERAGTGGRRTGWFENGLVFHEVITAYEPARRMTFSIAVDPATLREDSPERHAFEGGYFTFLEASYELTALDDGRVRLSLASRYVLQSGMNWYGKLWARAVVGDFQERVLAVLARRLALSAPVAVVGLR